MPLLFAASLLVVERVGMGKGEKVRKREREEERKREAWSMGENSFRLRNAYYLLVNNFLGEDETQNTGKNRESSTSL